MRTYQNHHCHHMETNVRISDSIATYRQYAERASEFGQSVLSSCEHGWQGNYYECYKAAKDKGLKLLFATEAYWVKNREEKDGTNCHIFLAAKNENGRQSLNDVLSEANISGFYRQPRLDVPLLLSLPKDDVWVTSACVAGWRYEDADKIWEAIADHFGKNFFFEVQYHNTPSQIALNQRILKLRDQLKIPIIMGCDSHYILEPDRQKRTDFLASKGIEYPEEEGWYLDMPNGDTAYQRFAEQSVLTDKQIEEAIANTNVFCDVEEYDTPIFNSDIKLPSMYPSWTQEQRDEEYKRLVWQGWENYKAEVPEDKWDHYTKEIEQEIQTVIDTKMADYFIDDYHIIKRGIENGGQLTRTGRGSAVSFFTNKLLGFTEVDRIAASVKMYPERFMSTTRILASGSLPDIDMNVADPEPFALAQQQVLGEDHAYPMIAYGTMKASAAWKLYAKSQDVPFETANAVSDDLKRYEMAAKHADEDETVDIYDYIEPQFREIFERSKEYRGTVVSWSIAPCSYLLYQGSIRREIGLAKVGDKLCCIMDGHWAEECHFLKNDLLTVQVVNMIYQTFHRIGMEPPTTNELLKLCENDNKVWDIYAKGATVSVNQVERPGTSARVRVYRPKNISELCAFIAAIRPGFKSMYSTFASRVPFSYGVKAFDDLIQTPEMPNSFVLYQEQEMEALHYAGIPMADCYTAIKNIAKKRAEKVLAYEEKFKSGFEKVMVEDEGKTEDAAKELSGKLWQIITDSSRYSFNASHSYCVALDSLYGAWLKANHPLEFYETALRIYEGKGDKDKMNELREEAESYFDIRFPSFRFGQDNRNITANAETNSLTNSLASIKGFGKDVGQLLYECAQQDFYSFFDILKWLDERSFKSAKVIPLVKIGYFRDYGNEVELMRLVGLFDFLNQGTAKKLSKDKVPDAMKPFVERHSTDKGVKGNELKSYTILDMEGLLADLEAYIYNLHLEGLPYRVRAENQKGVLGYVDLTTGEEADRRKLYILDIYPLKSKTNKDAAPWLYKVKCKSVGSGKLSALSIRPNVYLPQPVKEGDLILAEKLHKDSKGYWTLDKYQVIPA